MTVVMLTHMYTCDGYPDPSGHRHMHRCMDNGEMGPFPAAVLAL